MDPVRVFIGTEQKTRVPEQVLVHSIRRRTKVVVEFTPMIGPAWEYPTQGVHHGTGFSFRRWMIPAACGWRGRAVYLDADQLVLGDVAELWGYFDAAPAPAGTAAWCTYQEEYNPDKYGRKVWPQTSVMLLDCANARGQWGFEIDRLLAHLRAHPTRQAYGDFMHGLWLAPPPARIPAAWNHLNVYVPRGKPKHTRLLHYTAENLQPWYKPDHPLAGLWEAELADAVRAGAVDRGLFEEACELWSAKKLDHRKTQGLHPHYHRLRKHFPAAS